MSNTNKSKSFSAALLICALLIFMAAAVAQNTAKPAHHKSHAASATPAENHKIMTPDQLQWSTAPPALPQGAQIAVLNGNPMKAGPFIMRLKFPDGYKIAPHWHPAAENITVLSGELHAGIGRTPDESNADAYPAGSFAHMNAHVPHYASAKGETVIQVGSTGPFMVHYVNPSDDPRKK